MIPQAKLGREIKDGETLRKEKYYWVYTLSHKAWQLEYQQDDEELHDPESRYMRIFEAVDVVLPELPIDVVPGECCWNCEHKLERTAFEVVCSQNGQIRPHWACCNLFNMLPDLV